MKTLKMFLMIVVTFLLMAEIPAQTITHKVTVSPISVSAKEVQWTPVWTTTGADSTAAKWSNSFQLGDVTCTTAYYSYKLGTAYATSMKVIHYVNNYASAEDDVNWVAKDTITIASSTATASSISWTPGAYNKLKAENSGSHNTLKFGLFFLK